MGQLAGYPVGHMWLDCISCCGIVTVFKQTFAYPEDEGIMLSRQPLAALTAVLILGLAAGARAQTATGTILGNVRDKTGGAVPGATITATNLNTHAARSTVSDADGQYTLPLLPLGTY